MTPQKYHLDAYYDFKSRWSKLLERNENKIKINIIVKTLDFSFHSKSKINVPITHLFDATIYFFYKTARK